MTSETRLGANAVCNPGPEGRSSNGGDVAYVCGTGQGAWVSVALAAEADVAAALMASDVISEACRVKLVLAPAM